MNPCDQVTLFDFGEPMPPHTWQVLNDAVMGGRSSCQFDYPSNGIGVFQGVLAQGAAFAAVRCQPRLLNLSRQTGVLIRVRGDGRRYRFTLRVMPHFDYVLYQHGFETVPGDWQELALKWSGFVPTFRGRELDDAPPLDLARIASIGFLISDSQAGAFRLECRWIKAGLGQS